MIPKTERIITTYASKEHIDIFVVTQKIGGDTFFLYEVKHGKEIKLGKGNSPLELEHKFNVRQRMGIKDDK